MTPWLLASMSSRVSALHQRPEDHFLLCVVEALAEDLGGAQHGHESVQMLFVDEDRKSTRLNSSHITRSRMPSSA